MDLMVEIMSEMYTTMTDLHPQLIRMVAVGYNRKLWRYRN